MKRSLIKSLPDSPGIYQFFDENDKLLYVGKSVSVKKRVYSYFASGDLGPKTNMLVKRIAKVSYLKVFSEFEALLLESELIRRNRPFFNVSARDDKSPIYIKITRGDIPLISTTRRQKEEKGVFLKGPFPSAKATREIFRLIRRIFPYCHHQNPRKPCLYVHLGLCPYPWESNNRQEYRKTIDKIKKLLSGKTKILIQMLTREMANYANHQLYEEAQKVKEQIEKIQYLTTTYHAPSDFLENPSLVDDQMQKRLEDLKTQLELPKLPSRIECYDISNIGGRLATGSMVVFQNGQPDKSAYRRFRIKFLETPNDYEMLKEVIVRRFKNDWPIPDLLIIDGGRGQLNAAISVLEKNRLRIPIASLAKRFEEVYLPTKIQPISLPKDSPARLLAQAIRDEAHRFAITYHRLLRQRKFLEKIH